MIQLEGTRAPGALRLFRPEVASAIKLVGAIALLGLFVLSLSFGYQQRQLARSWQKVACAYRLQESVRRAPLGRVRVPLGHVRVPLMADTLQTPDSCAMLKLLGLRLEVSGQPSEPSAESPPDASREGS